MSSVVVKGRLDCDSRDRAGFKSSLPAASIRLLFAMCQEVVLSLIPWSRGPVTKTPIVTIRRAIATTTTLPIVTAIRVPREAARRAIRSKSSSPDGICQRTLAWKALHPVLPDKKDPCKPAPVDD